MPLSVYFKSTDRYNDNKEGGRANFTVWAYRMRQAQTVTKPFRAERCKVRDVKKCGSPVRQGLYWTPLLRAQPSGAKQSAQGRKAERRKNGIDQQKSHAPCCSFIMSLWEHLRERHRPLALSATGWRQVLWNRPTVPKGKKAWAFLERFDRSASLRPVCQRAPKFDGFPRLVFSGLQCDLEQEASRTLFLNFCSNFYSKKTSHFLYILAAIKVCFELAVTQLLPRRGKAPIW